VVGDYLRCSIGLAPNVWLSKVAADMQKPDGLTMILPEQMPEVIHVLKLTDLPGIGAAMERRLNARGVMHVHQLCRLSEEDMSAIWGSKVHGSIWYQQLRGIDLPYRPTHRRQVGHSHVLPPRLRTPDSARAVLVRRVSTTRDRIARCISAGGAPPTRGIYDYRAELINSSKQSILVPNAVPGDWYVLFYGAVVPETTPFGLEVIGVPLNIASISPAYHAADSQVQMTVKGIGFLPGTQLRLLDHTDNATIPTTFNVDSLSQITASLDLDGVPPGTYSVEVSSPLGVTTIEDGFTVVPLLRGPKLETRFTLPPWMGRSTPATLYIEYANTGDVAMPAPLIQLSSGDPDRNEFPLLTLDKDRLINGVRIDVLPEGFSHHVVILGSGAQAGVLQPGERVRVPVYYAGIMKPWVSGDQSFEFELTELEATDARGMNWNGVTYAQLAHTYAYSFVRADGTRVSVSGTRRALGEFAWLEDGTYPTSQDILASANSNLTPVIVAGELSARWDAVEQRWDQAGILQLMPETFTPDAWAATVENLRLQVGDTLGEWVTVLGENASYLAKQGVTVTDYNDLWAYEVLQASGLGPLQTLETVTDAGVPTPGLGLGMSRSFANNIAGRYAVGPFGRGWTAGWDIRLDVADDGAVTLRNSSTFRQRYEPDIRTPGNFFSQPGDTSILTSLPDGSYNQRQPDGTLTHFLADGTLNFVQDPNGNRITAGYNADGLLATLTHTSGATITVAYNSAGRIASVTESTGRSTIYTYDPTDNYLLTVTTDDGKVTNYTYQTTGPAAALHALTSIERGGTAQFFQYDSMGRVDLTYKTGNQEVVDFSYDTVGSVFVNDGLGTTTLFYDHRGLLVKVQDPFGNITQSQFDNHSRLTGITLPTGESQAFKWDPSGNLTTLTDELGHTSHFEYGHSLNRLTKLTDAKGNTTRYSYDAAGNLLATTYANNSVERYSDYDPQGLPQQYTNRRGQVMSYQYNTAGQVNRQTFDDGSFVDFTYDARGNLATILDGAETTTYSYEPATDGDRLARVTYPNGRFLDYTYDAFGRRIQMVDQDGRATKYEYDQAGRLFRLRDETDAILVTYSYDAGGRLSRIDKGNGTFTTYEYDAAGQILSLKNHRDETTLNSFFDYTYDNRGRRTSMDTIDGLWTYKYDATGQLTHAVFDSINPAIEDQDLEYFYDALGNRIRTIKNGVTTEYVMNALNQYTSVGGTPYTYDADGNLTFDGTASYQFDELNRLVRRDSFQDSQDWGEFEYDALGNRITATDASGLPRFIVDALRPDDILVENDENNSMVARIFHGYGVVAREVGVGGPRSFIDFDGIIASVVGITDQAGILSRQHAYDPFGSNLLGGGEEVFQFGYLGASGVVTDSGELVRTGARAYNPVTARFISLDVLDIGGGDINRYRYASNDPINSQDVNGLFRTPGGFIQIDPFRSTHTTEPIRFGFDKLHVGVKNRVNGSTLTFMRGLHLQVSNAKIYLDRFWLNGARYGTGWLYGSFATGYIAGTVIRNWLNTDEVVFQYLDWIVYGIRPPFLPPGNPSSSQSVSEVRSSDPNDKIGPAGYGDHRFILSDARIPYRINFENIGPASVDPITGHPYDQFATAPAQRVTITDSLSPDLDWSSFRVTEMGFGDSVITILSDSTYYSGVISVTIDGRTFDVELEAGIDLSRGRVFASFQSIDPETSLPPEVLTGFLPPEDGTGRGKGYFNFTIDLLPGLTTGTEIRNIALISFDGQQVIATNQVNPFAPEEGTDPSREAMVTIDAGVATSQVLSLQTGYDGLFLVEWTGSDDAGGSGIASYTVFVSDNGGPFEVWLANTPETEGVYEGEVGHAYAFYSVAKDNVGHEEAAPTAADAQTLVVAPDPPEVVEVLVRSSAWSSGFLDHLQSAGLGDGGYGVPFAAADQLRTLPWTNLDQIKVRFSEDVAVLVEDLTLRGLNVSTLTATDFAYDVITHTATWTFAQPLGSDKWLIDLSDELTDFANNRLDGEWANGSGAAASGDDEPGGDFKFRFNVLPADVTRSNVVLGDDVILVRNAQFRDITHPQYDPFLDVNGSGTILGDDVILARNLQFTNLPPGDHDLNPPELTITLANDTGSSSADGITMNATITGSATDASELSRLTASLNGLASVNILPFRQANGSLALDADAMLQINGGQGLAQGEHSLWVEAEDAIGNVRVVTLDFTLDTAQPLASTPISGPNPVTFSEVDVLFTEAMSAAAFATGSYLLQVLSGPDTGQFIAITTATQALPNAAHLILGGPLADGDYRLMVNAGLTDIAGNALDGGLVFDFSVGNSSGVQLFTDTSLSTPGLMGSYVNTSLRDHAVADDWRGSQAIAGTRVDPTINFTTNSFGSRAAVGVTGGSDANWENFSVQWDGVVRVTRAGQWLGTVSDDGSRMWIDLDSNGSFSDDELVNNGWGRGQGVTAGERSTPLSAGTFAVRVQYEEGGGGNAMTLMHSPFVPRQFAPTPTNPVQIVRAIVLNFDPRIPSEGNQLLREVFGWNDPHMLAQQFERDIEFATGGAVDIQIVEIRDLDEFPIFTDGFRYTPDEYVQNRRTNTGWHDGVADFYAIAEEQDLTQLVNAGTIDEIWMFGDHFFNLLGEAWMAGPNSFFINGPTLPEIGFNRAIAGYGFNYERGVAEMMHNLSHRTENHGQRAFGSWNLASPASAFDLFSSNFRDTPGSSIYGVGTTHFPANADSDYDYSDGRVVESRAFDFANYPNMTGATTMVSRNTWSSGTFSDDHRDYLSWYFGMMPRNDGTAPDSRQANWFKYIWDLEQL